MILAAEVTWNGSRVQRGGPLIAVGLVLWYQEGQQRKRAQRRVAGSLGSENMKEQLSAGSYFLSEGLKQDNHLRLRQALEGGLVIGLRRKEV